uniref:Hepatitis A virus cellular receptor 1 homolog n=1 Tax=Xiphophorus maculatus TaxID=8083 RepID=A0A3B5PS59_XIPMA
VKNQLSWFLFIGTGGFLCLIYCCRLFSVSSCTVTVTGYIGQDVTLPCSYDVQANGVLSFCWGHGQVPRSKCSNTILLSDNGNVTFRESPRYQLLSQVMQGDVSLTIVKAQKIDSGVYGCRVEIPGWFNDQKINITLTVNPGTLLTLEMATTLLSSTAASTKLREYTSSTNGRYYPMEKIDIFKKMFLKL